MPEKMRKLKTPCFIQLRDLKDLARLACSFERTPLPIFCFQANGEVYLATQLDVFMGRPIFYYVKTQEVKHFLGYRNTGGVEEATFSDSSFSPAYLYAPIISVARFPKLFQRGLEPLKRKVDKFMSIQVRDVASLAKVGSYKTLYEEPPLPLFSFTVDDKSILGVFARIDEYEEASLFFYITLDAPPAQNFVKYSPTKVEAGFTNRVDEHGNVYIKIIKLAETHPLVEL